MPCRFAWRLAQPEHQDQGRVGRVSAGKDTVSKYVSKAYRASIKASNKAAEKFAETPDQELATDIKAFLIKGAKDGDSPASCS